MIITARAKALYKRTQHYTLNVGSRGKQLVFLYRLRLHVCVAVFIHEKENWECFSRLLSRHFLPCFDLQCTVMYPERGTIAQMYHDRDIFYFSQGHVTKNQQMAVPV